MADSLPVNDATGNCFGLTPTSSSLLFFGTACTTDVGHQLDTMFRDPYLLTKEGRVSLIESLRQSIERAPNTVELRVLMGMALCVDLQVQPALEVLRDAVKQDPRSFISHLKLGELLMRLRVCDQAMTYTMEASRLASNSIQSESARRQAATLRTMMREGIERGGHPTPFKLLKRLVRPLSRRKSQTGVSLVGPA